MIERGCARADADESWDSGELCFHREHYQSRQSRRRPNGPVPEDEHDEGVEKARHEAAVIEVDGTIRIRDLETEYGTPGRAIAKTPVYISRLHTLTPPWMPFPVPELLLGLIAAAGIYLFTVLLFSPPRSR